MSFSFLYAWRDCLEMLAINGITGHDPCRALSAFARISLERKCFQILAKQILKEIT